MTAGSFLSPEGLNYCIVHRFEFGITGRTLAPVNEIGWVEIAEQECRVQVPLDLLPGLECFPALLQRWLLIGIGDVVVLACFDGSWVHLDDTPADSFCFPR